MHRRQTLKVLAGFGLCSLCAPTGLTEEVHRWSHEGATGPVKWGLEPKDAPCSIGDHQSAIDITGAIAARQPPLKISWTERPDTIVNNGHTIQLNFAAGNPLDAGERRYKLTHFISIIRANISSMAEIRHGGALRTLCRGRRPRGRWRVSWIRGNGLMHCCP
jgi:carbonic anhydrase